MDKNATIKALLSDSKNAFRSLHSIFGMDFEAPYSIMHFPGKFTVKQVVKLAAANGYTENCLLLVLTRDIYKVNWENRYRLAAINADGNIDIDFKIPYFENGNINKFYRKYDLDDIRKSDGADTFVIWQDKKYLKMLRGKSLDHSARFKLLNYNYEYAANIRSKYIYSINLKETTGKGESVNYKPYNYRKENIFDVIDKSGYLLQHRREELKQKANTLRKQRAKAIYMESDHSGKIKDLEKRVADRKTEIAIALSNANTWEELDAVGKSLTVWDGFAHVVRGFERFKNNVENKAYASIEDCEKAYNSILSELNKEEN